MRDTSAARATLPTPLHINALQKLLLLDAANSLRDLLVWRGLKLEKLKGSQYEEYSIRVNAKYRICFCWNQGHAYGVTITTIIKSLCCIHLFTLENT